MTVSLLGCSSKLIVLLFQVTVITQLCQTKANIKVLATVCSAVVAYCAKIYFTLSVSSSKSSCIIHFFNLFSFHYNFLYSQRSNLANLQKIKCMDSLIPLIDIHFLIWFYQISGKFERLSEFNRAVHVWQTTGQWERNSTSSMWWCNSTGSKLLHFTVNFLRSIISLVQV